MAKKKLLLNESVTRRFMKLAEINPTYVSNFINEEEEMEMEEEEGLEGEEDMEMEEEEGLEEEPAGAAEDIVMDFIQNAVAPWAGDKGVSMNVQGDEEEMEEEDEEDLGMEEEEPMEDEEMDLGGEEDLGMEEEELEANRGYMQEARRALRKANVSVLNENAIINRVVNRVAKRLLKESQQAKKPARRNIRRRRR